MTNQKRYARKVLSIVLTALMCLSVCMLDWSALLLPKAEAATAGNYTTTVSMSISDDDGDWTSTEVVLYMKKNNGTGDQYSESKTIGKNGSVTFTGGFPVAIYTRPYVQYCHSWSLTYTLTAKVGGSNVGSVSCEWSGDYGQHTEGSGTDAHSVDTYSTPGWRGYNSANCGGTPYINSVNWDTNNTSVTVPTSGTATVTNTATVKDQYGVNWYQDPSYSLSSTPSGISVGSSNGTVSVTNAAKEWVSNNQDGTTYQRTLTLTATCGSKSNTKTITFTNCQYYLDLNGYVTNTYPLNYGNTGDISGYGTADVSNRGSVVSNDCADYYTALYYGTSYAISDIKPATGMVYDGLASDSAALTGKITGDTNVRLKFHKAYSTLNVKPNSGTWNGSTADQSYTKVYNDTQSIPLPTKTYWTFTGWQQSSSYYGTTPNNSAAWTYTFPTNDAVSSTITATWSRDISATYHYYEADAVTEKTNPLTATALNAAETQAFTPPAVPTSLERNDKTWTFQGWSATATATTWGGEDASGDIAAAVSHDVSTLEASGDFVFYPVYSHDTTKIYADYYYYVDDADDYSMAAKNVVIGGDDATGDMPVPAVTDNGADGSIKRNYSKNGIEYALMGWSLTEGAESADFAYSAATATLDVPGGVDHLPYQDAAPSEAHIKLYPVYSKVGTTIKARFHYYDAAGEDTFFPLNGLAEGEATSGTVTFPSATQVLTSYAKNGRTYTLVGWNQNQNSEAYGSFGTTETRDVLANPGTDAYDYYPVYKTTTEIHYHYTTAADNVTADNYAVKTGDNFGGTAANINAKYVDIAVPGESDLSSLTYKKDGLIWKIVGWATTENAAAATYTLGQSSLVNVKVTDDGAAYDYYPVYEVYKKDLVSQYWYYDASGTYTHYDVTDPDKPVADTSAAVTMTAAGNVVTSYTTGGITYTLLGWQQDAASTEYHAFGASDTVALNDKTVTTIHFYPVYSATTTVKYHYYESNGSQASMNRTTDTLKADNTVPTETGVAVPTSGFNKTITLDGRTFTFCGWRLDTASAAQTVATTVSSENHAIRDEEYKYYAIYKSDDLTLSYNGINGAPIPEPQKKTQYINAGTGAANINNASALTFDINPDNVTPEKTGYTYIGWQDENNAEQETATYAKTGGTLTTKINKTLYAVYAINDMTVKFTYWSGNGYATDTTTIKYDDGTRSDTGAARYVTTGPQLDTSTIDHKDQTNHYYFTGWAIESGDAVLTENVNGTQKSATIGRALTDVNVQAKYQGVSHHWVTVVDDDHPYVDATCTEDGHFYHYCSDCGYYTYDAIIPATGHDMSYSGYKAPTCTKDGKYAIAVCDNCGMKSTDEGYGAAKYYDFVNGSYVPVESEDGKIAKLEHNWVVDTDYPDSNNGVVAPTCTSRGYTAYKCLNNAGHTKFDNYVDATGHTPVDGEAKAATCVDAGYTAEVKCSVCDAVVTASQVIPATGHTQVIDVAVAPTCTESGLTEGKHCSVCGAVVVAQEEVPALGHDYVYTAAEPATCTKPGHTAGSVCSRCGEVEEGQTDVTVIPALGHDFTGEGVYTESAEPCKTPGYTTYTCLNGCGETKVVYDELADHVEEAVPAKPATCIEAGYEAYTKCSVCGKALTEYKPIAKTAHTWVVDEAAQDADCENAGHTASYKCATEGCGATIEATEIAALGHSYGRWIVTKNATCTGAGEKMRVCARCSNEDTEELEALGHDWVEAAEIPATCAEAGVAAGVKCSRCGEIQSGCTVLPKLDAHTFGEYETVKDSTCTAVGVKKHTCTVCGLEETDVIEMKAHTFETLAAEEATCTAIGHTAGQRCTVCGYKEGYEAIAKKQHTEVTVGDAEATCTAAGSTGTVKCSVCGIVIAEAREIPAKGHKMGNWNLVKAPTCTETGSRERVCSVCGEAKETMTLDAIGHDMTLVPAKDAKCGVAGNIAYYTCSRCEGKYFVDEAGTAEFETVVIPALEHNWVVDTDAEGSANGVVPETCTTNGYTVEICTYCNITRHVNEVPATGHHGGTPTCKSKAICDDCGLPYGGYGDHNYEVETIAGTCKENGKEIKTCTVCGKVVTVMKGKGDHQVNHTIVSAPTCTQTGYYKDECSVCGLVIAEGTLFATGHHDADADGVCDDCGVAISSSGADGKCDKCGRNHAGEEGGFFGYNGFVCKVIAFARRILKMFQK